MQRQYGLVCLLLFFISGYQTQDSTIAPGSTTTPEPSPTTTLAPSTTTTPAPPTTTTPGPPTTPSTTTVLIPTFSPTWNGDPKLCTVDPSYVPPSTNPPLPVFTTKAEFAIERVEIKHILNITAPSVLTLYEYIYDYDNNKLILVTNLNGFITIDYYYYNILKKSTYLGRDLCAVNNISTYDDIDGNSAVETSPGVWHIRTMNEFLLFSSNVVSDTVGKPVYLGKDTIRGIPVDKWQTCIIDKVTHQTVSRTWTFAQKNFTMPSGAVDKFAVPVQALVSASYVFPDGTQALEFDEVFNVLSFRPGITETTDALSPPKGVYCNAGPSQDLVSLSDLGINWPDRFSVRVEASTSRTGEWQKFHLRYDHGRNNDSKRIRYDYMPVGAEDFESVIHDYSDNLTWIIDRRVGTCKISRGVELPSVSPTRNPIEFFIKHEKYFIYDPPAKAWEFNGYRSCRGNTIKCTILTALISKFPPVVEPDTGVATGETWEATTMEYGWSMRAPPTSPPPQFDYPVSLYFKLYRYEDPANPSITNLRTEDIEYEFYEMSYDRNPFDFDISSCYRSLSYDYLHLEFTLKINRDNVVDGNQLNRIELERNIRRTIITYTELMRYSRVADLQIDHERATNEVAIFFTILGQTPTPPSGVDTSELTVEQARSNLEKAIDGGQFQFTMKLLDNSDVQFTAASKTLKYSKQFMSTHASGKKIINESYSGGAQAGAVIGGILVGLVAGLILAAVIRIVRKQPMPAMPTSLSNPLPRIDFHARKAAATSSDKSKSVTSDA